MDVLKPQVLLLKPNFTRNSASFPVYSVPGCQADFGFVFFFPLPMSPVSWVLPEAEALLLSKPFLALILLASTEFSVISIQRKNKKLKEGRVLARTIFLCSFFLASLAQPMPFRDLRNQCIKINNFFYMKRAPLHRCSKSLQSCIQMGTAPQPNHPLPAHDNPIPPARAETSRALLFQHSTKALVEKGSTPPHGQDPSHKGLPVDLHMTSKMRTCLSNDFKAPRKTPVNLAQGNTFWCSLLHTRNIRCCISHCR